MISYSLFGTNFSIFFLRSTIFLFSSGIFLVSVSIFYLLDYIIALDSLSEYWLYSVMWFFNTWGCTKDWFSWFYLPLSLAEDNCILLWSKPLLSLTALTSFMAYTYYIFYNWINSLAFCRYKSSRGLSSVILRVFLLRKYKLLSASSHGYQKGGRGALSPSLARYKYLLCFGSTNPRN